MVALPRLQNLQVDLLPHPLVPHLLPPHLSRNRMILTMSTTRWTNLLTE